MLQFILNVNWKSLIFKIELENMIFLSCLLQGAFVLCRLFRKNDETLKSSNCDDAEGAPSSPAAKSSPEDTESDLVTSEESPPSLKNGHVHGEDKNQEVRNSRPFLSFYIHQ